MFKTDFIIGLVEPSENTYYKSFLYKRFFFLSTLILSIPIAQIEFNITIGTKYKVEKFNYREKQIFQNTLISSIKHFTSEKKLLKIKGKDFKTRTKEKVIGRYENIVFRWKIKNTFLQTLILDSKVDRLVFDARW